MIIQPIAAATQTYLAAIADANLTLEEFRREITFNFVTIRLEACHGNQCHAARELGIHRNTLARILDEMERSGRGKRPKSRRRGRRKPVTPVTVVTELARITGTR